MDIYLILMTASASLIVAAIVAGLFEFYKERMYVKIYEAAFQNLLKEHKDELIKELVDRISIQIQPHIENMNYIPEIIVEDDVVGY